MKDGFLRQMVSNSTYCIILYIYIVQYIQKRDIVYKGTISLKNRSCNRALSNRTLSTKSQAIL